MDRQEGREDEGLLIPARLPALTTCTRTHFEGEANVIRKNYISSVSKCVIIIINFPIKLIPHPTHTKHFFFVFLFFDFS